MGTGEDWEGKGEDGPESPLEVLCGDDRPGTQSGGTYIGLQE